MPHISTKNLTSSFPNDWASGELVAAIFAVNINQLYLSPLITDVVIREYLHNLPKKTASVFTILTAHERKILQRLSEGKTTKEIASMLNVSARTVEPIVSR